MGTVCGKKKKPEECSLRGVKSLEKESELHPVKLNEETSPVDKVEAKPASQLKDKDEINQDNISGSESQTELPSQKGEQNRSGSVDSNITGTGHGGSNLEIPSMKVESVQDVQASVDECWRVIERQCREHVGKNYPPSGANFSGWRAIRLFVSSTFQDFHNEREILVKKVFPELREWCQTCRLHLIECDLRWGVPKDSTTRIILTTCMEEIDRCHGDADGEGFFLNMLGERYGWVPSKDDVPNDIAEEYKWVPMTSVTHMEILLGAYHSRNPNAAFFLRDSSQFLDRIPEENKKQFLDSTEIGKLQLKELKSRLRERFPEQTFDYSCEFDSVQNAQVVLKGLDDFGRQALEFFKNAIGKKFPAGSSVEATPEKLEQDQHDIYMEQKGQLVFGRDDEIKKLIKFASCDQWNENHEDNHECHHMIVVADPGEGKSSLMARFVMETKKAGLPIFYHFVGCTAESNMPSSILKRLVARLEELYPGICTGGPGNEDGSTNKEGSADGEQSEDIKQNVLKLAEYVKKLREAAKPFVIIVDAVNQTSQEKVRYPWLPASIDGNLRCVMSTTREERTLEELKEHCSDAAELTLTALGDKARSDIVTNYFGRYNKTLDPEQLSLLTHSEGAINALWLSLGCEELRIYGVFEKLTDRIRELPTSLEGLIETILARLISEDDTGLVEKMLHFLQCINTGLKETELQVLLGDIDSGTPAPALHWSMVRRTLKPFLRNSGTYGEVERLQFFHLAINKAVQKRLMENIELKKLRHRQLADYYQYHCNDQSAVTNRLPRQLAQAKAGQRLVEFFRTDKRSIYVNKIEKSRLLKEFRCTNMTQSSFPSCTKFGFCQFCQNSRSKLAPNSPWQTKDCCVICGERVQFPGPKSAKAYWCPFHKPTFPAFGKYNCYTCQKSINMPKGEPALAYLCQFCDPGHMERCCKLTY